MHQLDINALDIVDARCNHDVPLTNLNKYLHNDTGETEVNINESLNDGGEKFFKKKATVTFSKLIIAVYASVVYVCISCTCLSGQLEYYS